MKSKAPPFLLEQRIFNGLNSPLLQYASNVQSQNGEDGILSFILHKIPSQPEQLFCVEFGAWDGVHLSNCYNLIWNFGYRGLLIEANKLKYSQLESNYRERPDVKLLNQFVDFEGEDSLNEILSKANVPVNFNLLSIDVDGTDCFIWQSLTTHRPRVVVIEFNPTVPNDVVFVQAKDSTINQGASLLAMVELGKQLGYELLCCTVCNAIFILKEYYNIFGLASNHPSTLYRPVCNGRIFHGFDSVIHIVGMPLLIWSNQVVNSEKLQIIEETERYYSDTVLGRQTPIP